MRIEKINAADTRQIAMSTPQMIERFIPHIKPGTMMRKLPIAVATNQPPIIIPLYLGGATLDTNEIPMGESKSSAMVSTK